MKTYLRHCMLTCVFVATIAANAAQGDSVATTGRPKLLKPTLEAGIGLGFVTFKETYTWNGQPVPDNQIEKWAMPQLYVGGRVPIIALSEDLSLQAVLSASFMLVVQSSGASEGVIDVPLHIVARYGYGSTQQSDAVLGFGVGAGASLMWWDAFGILDVVPAVYADVAVKGVPIYLRSSINIGSVAFSTYDTVSLWSLSLNWRGALPTNKDKGY